MEAKAKEVGTPWCHFGYSNNLARPTLAKRSSICRGSCSICLLMSTVVGGAHVCHVTRLAGSTFTWRSDHRGKWQRLWQMFSLSWGGSHQRAVQSEGLGCSTRNNCHNMCLPRPARCETRRRLFLQNDVKHEKTGPLMWPKKEFQVKCVKQGVQIFTVWTAKRFLVN